MSAFAEDGGLCGPSVIELVVRVAVSLTPRRARLDDAVESVVDELIMSISFIKAFETNYLVQNSIHSPRMVLRVRVRVNKL